MIWAVLIAAIVGSWKYFKRTPSLRFGATGNTISDLPSGKTWKAGQDNTVTNVRNDVLLDASITNTTYKKTDQSIDASKPVRTQATPPGASKAMSSPQPTANPISPVSIPAEPSQNAIEAHEERLYEQIAQELDTNTVDKGLWTKAYAQAGGDDQQTRVLYIKARFARLLAIEDA